MDIFYRANVMDGLFHELWSIEYGTPSGSKFIYELNKPYLIPFFSLVEHFTIGPPTDSGYEYIFKHFKVVIVKLVNNVKPCYILIQAELDFFNFSKN